MRGEKMKQVIEFTNLKETFVEAHIADLHFGTIEPATEYKILNEQFLNYLEKMNVLDIVSINGDIFDHKFMQFRCCNICNIFCTASYKYL